MPLHLVGLVESSWNFVSVQFVKLPACVEFTLEEVLMKFSGGRGVLGKIIFSNKKEIYPLTYVLASIDYRLSINN